MNVVRRNQVVRGETATRHRQPPPPPRSPAGGGSSRSLNFGEWLSPALLQKFTSEGTDAHRVCTIEHGWVDRFGSEFLISFKNTAARDRLILELYFWRDSLGV